MPRWEAEQNVTQSVIERLIDLNPGTTLEPSHSTLGEIFKGYEFKMGTRDELRVQIDKFVLERNPQVDTSPALRSLIDRLTAIVLEKNGQLSADQFNFYAREFNARPTTRTASVAQLKHSLRRDLEWLLNTRQTPLAADNEYPETQKSLYNYGLPDLSSINRESSHDRNKLIRSLEEVVATFEPRISNLRVVPLEADSGAKHILRFQIEGMLEMDPAPEHVTFDTVLQLTSGEYQVKGEPSA